MELNRTATISEKPRVQLNKFIILTILLFYILGGNEVLRMCGVKYVHISHREFVQRFDSNDSNCHTLQHMYNNCAKIMDYTQIS